jgi:spore maturation protein CgeB
MYQALRRSLITLNSHIDMVGREAGNARLFEATGVGTFLLTDFKDNLQTLFEPSREVVAWRSVNECLSMIDRYLNDEDERTAVAMASQHTFDAHVQATRDDILQFVGKS